MFKKIALILVLFTCISFAQKDHDPFMYSGSKAVLFSFSGLSNLGANNFDGGAGFKFYLTSPMALRIGVQVGLTGSTVPANPSTGQTGMDGTTSQTSFGVEAALEYHLTTSRVSPYFGGGVGFGTSSNELKSMEVGTGTLTQITVKDYNGNLPVLGLGLPSDGITYKAGTSFNVFALMGIEYFIVDAVSLSGEYRLGYTTLSPSDQVVSSSAPGSTSQTTKGTSSHSFNLNSIGVLTLAVYF
jgi:hypothetical protein